MAMDRKSPSGAPRAAILRPGIALQTTLRQAETAVYRHIRDPRATSVRSMTPTVWRAADFMRHAYCLLVTYKRSGEPVPTPVWFAVGDGRLYIRSGATDGKVKRIQRNSRVLVAPCTFRGRPLGPPVAGEAFVLGPAESARAEEALRRRFGLRRRVYQLLRDPTLQTCHLAVRPTERCP